MNRLKIALLSFLSLFLVAYLVFYLTKPKNKDPLKTELVTSDIDNFWLAFDKSKPEFSPSIFQETYIDKGSKGINNFMNYRIRNTEYFSTILKRYPKYYTSIRTSTEHIQAMKEIILVNLVEFKKIYPNAVFPPVYFVVGVLNTGGTSFRNGLIVGAEMYALTPESPIDELSDWQRAVLKPVDGIPSLIVHELVHFQQNNSLMSLVKTRNLLSASIDEGAADFIAELISGKHLNSHVHDFANPLEEELWNEFKESSINLSWINDSTARNESLIIRKINVKI